MPDTKAHLLELIAAYPGISQGDLAQRARISTRTARRHLKAFAAEGVVLFDEEGPTHRYRLADQAHPTELPNLKLTEGELEALAVAVLAARPLLAPTPLVQALSTAEEKLRRRWLAEAFSFEADTDLAYWSFDGASGGASAASDATTFRALLAAIREQSPVCATYYTASRNALTEGRHLLPLGFCVRNGDWLVPAVDLDADDRRIKDFALAGFCEVSRLKDEHVLHPEDFDLATYTRDRFGALDGEVELVRLLVTPEALPAFKRKQYNPTQQIDEERPDGSAVVSFEAAGMEAVKAWCLSWGAKIKVLDPPELALQVADAHREAARSYGS